MAFNIGSIEYLSGGRLRIDADVRRKLQKTLGAMAESNFIEDDDCVQKVKVKLPDLANELEITRLWWSGEGSGRSEKNLRKALSKTHGSADLLLTWEGGESHTGLRVVDGKVTEHEVIFTLGAEVQP